MVELLLRLDAKNYHAWAHRQWVCLTFGAWDGELEFAAAMIAEDVRNNSAWNHRETRVHDGRGRRRGEEGGGDPGASALRPPTPHAEQGGSS